MKFEKEKLMKMLERVKTDSTSQQLIIMVPLQFKSEIADLINDYGWDIDVIRVPEKFKDDGKTIYIVPISNNVPEIIYVIK